MTKVTINEQSPSAQLVAQATAETTITDSRGRCITLRKPGVLAQFRLIEALGETARNEVYVRMVLPLLYVSAIDGEPEPALTRKSEVEALIQRLDEDGIAAVVSAVNEQFGSTTPAQDQAAVKK